MLKACTVRQCELARDSDEFCDHTNIHVKFANTTLQIAEEHWVKIRIEIRITAHAAHGTGDIGLRSRPLRS